MRQSEVLEYLQISRTTLIEWETKGLIHPKKLPSGHRRYHRPDVEALLTDPAESREPEMSRDPAAPRPETVPPETVSGHSFSTAHHE